MYYTLRSFKLVLLVMIVLTENATSLNILSIFAVPAKSHMILGQALMKGLAEQGHEVTMVSPMPLEIPVKNYRDVVIPNRYQMLIDENETNNTIDLLKDSNPITAIFNIFNSGLKATEMVLSEKAIQKLLKSPHEKFDIVIVELFLDEAVYAVAHHFNAPLIVFSTIESTSWTNDLVGNVAPIAAIPEVFLGFTNYMNFSERLLNTLISLLNSVIRYCWYLPSQETIMKKYFKIDHSLKDIMLNTSLVLINSHVSLAYPRPTVPNMIEIGGFHIENPKPLPKDLQKFIDESPHGVIYFSMGSNLKSADLTLDKRDAFLKVFSSLKQRVLWKFEHDKLPNQPSNVMISKWFPQTDILAHPNVKMFITHGGLLSSMEAIARGVPVLGIPVYGDQKMNTGRAVTMGYGIQVEFANITEKSILWGINEILSNPKYTENIKERSKVLQDREVDPLKSAIYWIEYVARYKGAHHLRCSTTGMPLYKYLLLDVIAFIIIISIIVLALISLVFRCLCKFVCTKHPYAKKNKRD